MDDALTLSVADDRLRYVGDLKSNPRVRPGDIVMIPSGAIRVQVLGGRVARTGEVEVRKGATVWTPYLPQAGFRRVAMDRGSF